MMVTYYVKHLTMVGRIKIERKYASINMKCIGIKCDCMRCTRTYKISITLDCHQSTNKYYRLMFTDLLLIGLLCRPTDVELV